MPRSKEALEVPIIEMYSYCAAKKKLSYKKRFKTCYSSIINSVRIIDRAYTNYAFNSSSTAYSFYKSFLIIL
jgi:hypothetical protein